MSLSPARRNLKRPWIPTDDRLLSLFAGDRARLVGEAERAIADGSRSFSLASRLFARKTRERAWLLYAWCRHCDDLIDGQSGGGEMRSVPDPQHRLALVRELTRRALGGERTSHPAFDALGLVVAEMRIPHEWPEALIAGFAMDADGFRPASQDDLLRYCWHVAGVVGVMMAALMGVAPGDRATLRRAADLGLAFQLSNIARDLVDDWRAGRCYVPADWLEEEGLDAATYGEAGRREALARIATRLVNLGDAHEASALHGTPMLPHRSAAAVIAAARIYGAIGRQVRTRGAAAWQDRVTISRPAKLGHVAAAQCLALVRTWRWPAAMPRPPLWSPPGL